MVRDFQDGHDVDQVLLVGRRGARQARRRRVPAPDAGDRTGRSSAMVWDDVERSSALCAAGAPVRVAAATASHPRYGAAGRPARPALSRRRARSTSPTSSTARRARPSRWRPTCASSSRRSRTRTCAPCSSAFFGEGTPTWAALPRGARGQALPPGLPRTGCSSTASTVAQAVSAISATFPGIDRDVAVTGALLHDIGKLEAYTADPAGDRPDRRRPPAGRDPAGLLPRPPRDRGARRLPAAPGRGAAAHHPQPPRRARARLARRALHARGDARAHDRQPRRPARLLRPPREGAAARRGVVGLRPRARRGRLVRPAGDRRRAPRPRRRSRSGQGASRGLRELGDRTDDVAGREKRRSTAQSERTKSCPTSFVTALRSARPTLAAATSAARARARTLPRRPATRAHQQHPKPEWHPRPHPRPAKHARGGPPSYRRQPLRALVVEDRLHLAAAAAMRSTYSSRGPRR